MYLCMYVCMYVRLINVYTRVALSVFTSHSFAHLYFVSLFLLSVYEYNGFDVAEGTAASTCIHTCIVIIVQCASICWRR